MLGRILAGVRGQGFIELLLLFSLVALMGIAVFTTVTSSWHPH